MVFHDFFLLDMELLLDSRGRRKLKSLLIIYLFVMNTAGGCPPPSVDSTMILSDEARLLNDFPEGTEVTLLCARGHFSESGPGIITCKDEMWTDPSFKCSKKDCGPPTPQPFMHFNTSAGTLFGASVKATCDIGYRISGMSYLQCFDVGWFGGGVCKKVTCGKPPEVINGKVLWTSEEKTKYEETVMYSCDDGYTLTGNSQITCAETGEYNSLPPTCEGVPTERTITTKTVTSSITTTQGATTPTLPVRDSTITVPASTGAVSPSQQGDRKLVTPGPRDAPTIAPVPTSPSHEGYEAVIISVVVVTLVACICAFFLNQYCLRKTGSYDTGEDLKPELLQFQNL